MLRARHSSPVDRPGFRLTERTDVALQPVIDEVRNEADWRGVEALNEPWVMEGIHGWLAMVGLRLAEY